MSDKLKITDLIAKAEANRDRKKDRQEIFVKSLGTIVIEEPDNAVIMEASDMDGTDADAYLIYRCVVDPDLTSEELKKALGVPDPVGVVCALIPKSGERKQLTKACMSLAGYGEDSVKVIKDIKN